MTNRRGRDDGGVPLALAEKIASSDLERLAGAYGWVPTGTGLPGVTVLRRGEHDTVEILVPEDRKFADYADGMAEAVKRLAEALDREPREVLSELLMPAGDLLRFRVHNPTTETGFLSLLPALELLQSCKLSLVAAARTVRDPRKYFARLGTPETDEYLDTCLLATERGSFVATVLCPLYGKDLMKGQVPFPGFGVAVQETFSRKVVATVLRSARTIVNAIESDRMDTLVDQKDFDTVISANICEALAQAEDVVTETHPLRIEAQLSPLIPMTSPVPSCVELHSRYFPMLRAVATSLRPLQEPKMSHFVGRVVSLSGDRAQGRLDGGDVVLAFVEDDRIAKARLTLSPDDYTVAIDAYRDGHNVSVRGVLEAAPRISKIKDPTEFADITAKPSGAASKI